MDLLPGQNIQTELKYKRRFLFKFESSPPKKKFETKTVQQIVLIPACTIDRDSRSDFCDRDSRSDFGVVVERANHNFLEGVPSLYL